MGVVGKSISRDKVPYIKKVFGVDEAAEIKGIVSTPRRHDLIYTLNGELLEATVFTRLGDLQ